MRIGRLVITLLLLCTALWISSCGEQQEVMTAEMQLAWEAAEPIYVSVIMPDEGDIFSLVFQIDGVVYRAQGQPILQEPLEPHIPLISEDGKQTVTLSIAGFFNEEALIKVQLFPEDMRDYWSWSYIWCCQPEAFAPLREWLETRNIINMET